ncbi:MAG: RdgB/HAM1 family non-canonical purine NTP pyrophosphatase [Nitrososphaerota archaeon]
MKVVLATSNLHKAREFMAIFKSERMAIGFEKVATLELQSDSLEEIAVFSSIQAYTQLRRPLFVEDAGLFINSLGGFPGPYSSYVYRTIGVEGVVKLVGHDRKATFVSVIAYYDGKSQPRIFRGSVKGQIAEVPRGRSGFGFDPIFIPAGYDTTFAELGLRRKMTVSHRSRSALRLIRWLRRQG